MHQKHGHADGGSEKAQIHRRVKSGKGIGLHPFPPFQKIKWLWKRKNVTITIPGKHSPVTAGLPTYISDEAASCLLRGSPQ
jgi:hypothetical protein